MNQDKAYDTYVQTCGISKTTKQASLKYIHIQDIVLSFLQYYKNLIQVSIMQVYPNNGLRAKCGPPSGYYWPAQNSESAVVC